MRNIHFICHQHPSLVWIIPKSGALYSIMRPVLVGADYTKGARVGPYGCVLHPSRSDPVPKAPRFIGCKGWAEPIGR